MFPGSISELKRNNLILIALILVILFGLSIFSDSHAASKPPVNFLPPVDGEIISAFNPPMGHYGEGGHQGIDIAAQPGTPVRSSADGVVSWVGRLPRGAFVSVIHPGGLKTVYLGLKDIFVKRNESVRKGQLIGILLGLNDNSSEEPHLHFGAYLNGKPVNPAVLLGREEIESFIRLCPDLGPSTRPLRYVPDGNSYREAGCELERLHRSHNARHSSALKKTGNLIGGCFAFLLRKAKESALGAGRLFKSVWSNVAFPFLKSSWRLICRSARFVWSNKWVKAVTAGILAAVVVVFAIAFSVVALGVTLAAGLAAAIAGVVASLGGAVFFAFIHKGDFTFSRCFLFCLSAGSVAACFAGSLASLSSALSTGVVRLGAWGIIKSGLSSGAFSMIFEASWQYLTTGHITARALLIAFTSGAITGLLGRTLVTGIRSSSRFFEAASRSIHGTGVWERFTSLCVRGLSYIGKLTSTGVKLVVTRGAKIGYMLFSGSFNAGLHISICAATRTPIRVSNLFAAFCTGLTIGMISLSFGGEGLGALFERLNPFKSRAGRFLKRIAVRICEKMLGKGIRSTYRFVYERVFGEKTLLGEIEQGANR